MQLQQLLKSFFSDKPKLLQRYVDIGLGTIGLVLRPINVFMRHLLVIQNLDPNSIPGLRAQVDLENSLRQAFTKTHDSDYDSDFDLNWVKKKFEKVREDAKWGDLTQETFVSLTDVSKLSDETNIGIVNPIAPECSKRELPIFDPGPGTIGALRDVLNNVERVAKPKPKKKMGIKTFKKKLNKR